MLRPCKELITNHSNMRNFKIVCRRISFLNRNTGEYLDVQRRKNLTSSDIFKVLGRQSLLDLTPTVENKYIYARRIHVSTPTWLDFKGPNQKQEELKNYIFFSVLGGICLAMYLFSRTMRTHEDYILINSDAGKK